MNRHLLLALSIFLLFMATQAATATTFTRLPEADTLDAEVTTNRTFTITRNQLEVALELDATTTNNVEVAFGVDANEDGILDAEEEFCTLGWDCGAWFISDKTMGETIISECESGRRKLSVTFDFAANGTLRHLEVTDNTVSILNPNMKVPRTLMNQRANRLYSNSSGNARRDLVPATPICPL